jgi:hypothetical protein
MREQRTRESALGEYSEARIRGGVEQELARPMAQAPDRLCLAARDAQRSWRAARQSATSFDAFRDGHV